MPSEQVGVELGVFVQTLQLFCTGCLFCDYIEKESKDGKIALILTTIN